MLVEVGEALRVGRAMHRDHQALAPAQVQQALGVVGVVMGLEDAIEAMGREALARSTRPLSISQRWPAHSSSALQGRRRRPASARALRQAGQSQP